MVQDIRISLTVFDEHTGDEYRFRNRSFARSGDLEGFTRIAGEAVEVETVVPVGSADQRELVRSQIV